MAGYVTLSVLLGAVLTVVRLAPGISAASLYDPNDPLWELDSGNFERLVYGKSTAWIVEFYNSWCGHCIRFAPKWKEFARDIENWNKVIEIGVVNCNDAENTKICRQYDVAAYPTIKLLPNNLNESEQGILFEGSRELSRIRHATIDYIQSLNNTPSHWPNLNEVEANNLEEFWTSVPSDMNVAYVVLEPPESYLGREVILDLSGERNVAVRRVTSLSPLKDHLVENFDNFTVAIFLKLNRHGEKEILNVFKTFGNETVIRDIIFETLTGKIRVKEEDEIIDPDKPDDKTVRKGVYMADLENALRYSLRQEVGVHSDISGPALKALREFVTVLRLYFPSSPPIESYLIKLSGWVRTRKGNLTGERFVKALDNLQTKTEYLPDMHEYAGCKGSTPKYRGYPCSLWTLFHTLTLEAYDVYERINSDENNIKPQDILFAIRGYVTHFFTCRGCSLHFQEMAKNLEEELKNPKDGVMWLWRAHNKVNKRLSGDATEDPAHPKIQFPSKADCEKCHIEEDGEEIQWDENAVFRYLQYYYKKSNIKPVKSSSRRSRVKSDNDLDMHVSIVDDASEGHSTGNGSKLSDYSLILAFLSIFRPIADF